MENLSFSVWSLDACSNGESVSRRCGAASGHRRCDRVDGVHHLCDTTQCDREFPVGVIGGHVIAVIVGSVFAGLLLAPQFGQLADESHLVLDGIAAISVGPSIFLMALTNT